MTAAVRVRTPSRSKRHAAAPSGSPSIRNPLERMTAVEEIPERANTFAGRIRVYGSRRSNAGIIIPVQPPVRVAHEEE